MSITPATNTVESHTLTFDDETQIEVTIEDNGDVDITVHGTSPIVFSADVWNDIVKFVNAAKEMTA